MRQMGTECQQDGRLPAERGEWCTILCEMKCRDVCIERRSGKHSKRFDTITQIMLNIW